MINLPPLYVLLLLLYITGAGVIMIGYQLYKRFLKR